MGAGLLLSLEEGVFPPKVSPTWHIPNFAATTGVPYLRGRAHAPMFSTSVPGIYELCPTHRTNKVSTQLANVFKMRLKLFCGE